ncbi:unnamed protein product [Diabrotica balteata]|uniref:Fucosyltransferase n=1 Tax=Diabrotica balteata TaxID=107213 RepID=A0A9N9X554_DIABA|nr:unnamed protein product [Diabrotica balteata]
MKTISYHQKQLYILCIILAVVLFSLCIQMDIVRYNTYYPEYGEYKKIISDIEMKLVEEWKELRSKQTNLSNLGKILFLGTDEPVVNTTKSYQILVWKYGPTIERRLIKNFSKNWSDPFSNCPVKNCDITYKDEALSTADLVLFHLHRMKSSKELPSKRGKPGQIWAFITEESAHNTFLSPNKGVTIKDYNGVFNWSMSYRMDSDIPVPYGRTILRKTPQPVEIKFEKQRNVLVAVMGSNCGGKNKRWDYVKQLEKHIKIDKYGKCGTLKCPGHFTKDCPAIDKYLFYLSFENSNCDEYITEKVWWNAFHKNSIPIVMGASVSSYKKILPPNSYINVDDFANPASLARFLLRLNDTNEYLEYYQWKSHFEVLNEHGYFQSNVFHYCRVCQALNYNDKKQKVYEDLQKDWNAKNVCYPAWNA